ncbi:MAG: hypothetical protein WCI53_11885 [Bacteroidota bacterium]|jgi:hypothetical protein
MKNSLLIILFVGISFPLFSQLDTIIHSPKKKTFKITTPSFGGISVLATNVNNQFTVLTGGRGEATFNNRYTFGGAGWGMLNGVDIESKVKGRYDFFRFGYGGLEFGYIIKSGKKINFGTNILVAMGIGFKETVPKSISRETNFFPLIEPSLYLQIVTSKSFMFDFGIKYRYVTSSNISYLNTRNLNSFSIYIAFLISKCNCK